MGQVGSRDGRTTLLRGLPCGRELVAQLEKRWDPNGARNGVKYHNLKMFRNIVRL